MRLFLCCLLILTTCAAKAQVVLTELEIMGLPVPVGQPFALDQRMILPKPLDELSQIELGHDDALISVAFSFNSYVPAKVDFAYQLVGWDNDWVDVTEPVATWRHLPSGHYEFRVRTRIEGGDWKVSDKALVILKRPPFWASWWANLIYSLLIAGFVGLLIRFKLHVNLIRVNHKLEDKISRHSETLQQRTFELEQATAAKSDFLAKMSHEIRTPMNAVIGLSRLVLKSNLDSRQRDHIEKVMDAGESLLGLINDILDFSKIEAGKLSIETVQFNLAQLVNRAVSLSAMSAHEKGLELVVDIDEALPYQLAGDPLRLQQIFVNLVNNAVKFTESGAVCLRVRRDAVEGEQVRLLCSVQDTGIGMTPVQQSKLFLSYSQADETVTRTYGGTGLGLSISKQLCELMGGEIWVESSRGEGTTFHFTVQVKACEVAMATPKTKPYTGKKALVVEDVALSAQVVERLLQELGFECVCFDNGQSALDWMAAGHDCDFVLMDWAMPGLDGIATLERMGERLGDHLLMTSHYDKDQAMSETDSPIVEKPFNRSVLLEAIEQLHADPEEAAEPQKSHSAWQVPDFSNHDILLVEDNPINRQVALGFLADTGIGVVCAKDGREALEKLQHSRFELVLMDIEMPEMDGIATTHAIRNQLGLTDLPILAMTAHALNESIEKAIEAGMTDPITKPIVPMQLYEVLGKYLKDSTPSPISAPLKTQSDATCPTSGMLSRLAGVEGLNCEKALAAMNGRTALYLDLVKDFGKQQALQDKLKNLYEQQAWEELYRAVHSLKSNAAYIGAYHVSQLSESVENAYSHGNHESTLLEKLCAALDPLVEQLNLAFDEPPAPQQVLPYDAMRFGQLLLKILPLLEASNIAVDDLMPELLAISRDSEYADDVEKLAELVDDIEYEAASVLACALVEAVYEKHPD